MRQRERIRCREHIEALAGSSLDAEEIRHEVIAALRRAIGFESWCWPLTDPDSALSVSGIGEFDFWPSLPEMVALEERGDVTRKPRLVLGRQASIALSAATDGDLARSRRWRECLQPYGIGDELMTACRDSHGCWGSVELMRGSDDAAFDEDATELLEALAPALGTLLRRSLPGSWQATRDDDALPRGPGTLVLDSASRPVGSTTAFREWLAELPPAGGGLPMAIYEIAARVLTPPEAATGLPTSVRLPTRAGRWSVIEGDLLDGSGSGRVVITIRAATSEEVFDILCKAYGLSRRERELLALMLTGLATKQLAESMFISPHTVQDHLKSIFAKTGLRSRREVITHLTGQTAVSAAA